MASKSLAPSLRLIPLNLLHFFCTYVASNQVFSHHWGQLRLKDEMSLLSTRQFVTSNRESLCTRREKGWSNYSLSCPPPGRLGFASHQRELLISSASAYLSSASAAINRGDFAAASQYLSNASKALSSVK
jgi:hypothetical protein